MSSGRFRSLSVLAVFVVAALVAACGGNPPPATPAPVPPPPPVVQTTPPPPPPVPPPTPPATPAAAPTEAELFARMSLEELNTKRPLTDVFFHYDASELDDRARTTLQTNADWMKKWTSTRIRVEGHADARGTSEYNLALGERRASSVRDYLVSLGIDTSRVNVVSLGEEQATCTDETEACWAQNRRSHFVITAK